MYYYYIILLVILGIKLIFWSFYFYYRQRRVSRMVQAGLIAPAPTVGAAPTIATVGSHGNYNTAYWTGAGAPQAPTAPPTYDSITKDGQYGPPPPYQEPRGVKA